MLSELNSFFHNIISYYFIAILIYSKYKLITIIKLCFFNILYLHNLVKNYIMKKAFNTLLSSQKNKCKCGKTQNPNGNCDGSHANKIAYKKQ